MADPVFPMEASLEYHNGIRGSVLSRFEDSGHAPNLEEVVRFNETLAEFLGRGAAE